TAEKQCDATAQMLGQIAAASMDADTIKDFYDYEYLSKEELSELFDNIDTAAMLEAYGLSDIDQFVLMDRGCNEALNGFLTDENLEAWKTYALYSLYDYYSEVCDSQHRNPSVGGEGRVPDDKLARDMLKKLYKEELAYLWSVRYVPEGTKESAQKLATDIRDQMREHILAMDWMSEETRKGALQKIDQMGLCVAYPDEWENNYQSRSYEMKSKEEGGQLLTEFIQYDQYEAQKQRERLNGLSDQDLWRDTASSVADVNCYYNAQHNHIYILSGMLREPFFSVDNSYEENLGGIGMVIGHEITHGFDSQGARFDADGFYHDWWTAQDKERFDKECDRIADYYEKYRIMDIYHIDGRYTLTENIADLGGLSLISDVCPDNRQALQTMYQSYVNVWMTLESETGLVSALKTDIHSPAEARVNAVLSNTDRFYDAYDITPEDQMYVPKEDRVGIW
ncbi:MAG: M13 family metallopeptidase, partial [bacterium]|nr:M13 family metallopeptidase [bacterium]